MPLGMFQTHKTLEFLQNNFSDAQKVGRIAFNFEFAEVKHIFLQKIKVDTLRSIKKQ